jgi:MoxR-like ATPase
MARLTGADAIYEAADLFRQRCLVEGRSFLWPEHRVWTVTTIDAFVDAFMGQADYGKGTFVGKLRDQLAGQPDDVVRVAADVLAFYFLFPVSSTISPKTKLDSIQAIVDWRSDALAIAPSERKMFETAFAEGIGSTGPDYLTGRPWHLAFYLAFARGVITDRADPYDPESCKRLIDELKKELNGRIQARHILLHLLFPDQFEATASEAHKQDIVSAFHEDSGNAQDLDDALANIRQALSERRKQADFSFYDPDIRKLWDPATKLQKVVSSSPNCWIEKTQVLGWPYRSEGEFAVGRALVSPIRAAGGADLYRNLRQIQPGDIILHFTDRQGFTGRSQAAGSSYEIDTQPGFGIETDRTLVVPLRDHFTLDPPLSRQVLFAPPYAPRLERLLDAEGKNTFYRANPDLELRPQAYVTPASDQLIAVLQDAYRDVAGQDLVPEDWDRAERQPRPTDPVAPMLDDLAAVTYLNRTELMELEALLEDKRQLVLEGPPGSGKTFLATHFARYFAGLPLKGVHDERVETVQFHQSYGYEDFVQGIRPITDEHGQLQYHVLPGIFMRMCDLAARNSDERFVLIIDEINRGNLSRIFGELLLLLEYRDKRVRLPYGAVDGKDEQAYLTIPRNLYLIGTMNSTDRSLALIDYALRRRFFFYRLLPVVDGQAPVLDRWLTARGVNEQDRERVVRLFVKLNREVEHHLGSEFQIGHSYFMRDDIGTDAGMNRLWRRAIMPLLEEYLHGARDRETVLIGLMPEQLLSEPEPIEAPLGITADEP